MIRWPLLLVMLTALASAAEPQRPPPGTTSTEHRRLSPNPRRSTPPPGLQARAPAIGARAPEVRLPSTVAGSWSLKEALARGPAVLVFYRGDW